MAPFKQISKSLFFSALLCAMACFSTAEAAETGPSQPSISTSGSGEVSVSPDSFRISVGVEAGDKSLDKARREVNAKMEQILEALKTLDVPGLSLRTQILQINPVYAQGSETPAERLTPPTITGYEVTNAISVAVIQGDPDKLGDYASRVIDEAIRSGANRVGNINFFLQDQAAAQDRALQAAVQDAMHKAQVIAWASGVRIVGIETVAEGFSTFGLQSQGAPGLSAAVEGVPTPVESGTIVVTANVTARFLFEK